MKLLFDENLSESLCELLEDVFPDSRHVRLVGLQGADDPPIAHYAEEHDCAIVTKDSDFVDTAILRRVGCKVIWVRLGNCTTAQVHLALRNSRAAVEAFESSEEAVLELP